MEYILHQWPDLLGKYLADTLSPDEWQAFEHHLAGSALKRAVVDVYTNYSFTAESAGDSGNFDTMAEWEKFAATISHWR